MIPLAALPASAYWRLAGIILAAFAAATLWGYVASLKAHAERERANAIAARAETAEFRAAYGLLAAKVKEQNDALESMVAASIVAQKATEKARADAAARAQQQRAAAARLRKSRPATCDAAVAAAMKAMR